MFLHQKHPWTLRKPLPEAAGDLFGTTADGGADGFGTVFEIAKTSTGYASTPTTLASIDGTNRGNPVGCSARQRRR
jgi:uncharacterized repeat protein (TIGR03803 family)